MPDDRCFEHRRVPDQRLLDFERRYPDAAHLQHVVTASAIAVITVGIAGIGVAGISPLAAEGAARLVPLVPVALSCARSLDDQLTGTAIRRVRAAFGDDP